MINIFKKHPVAVGLSVLLHVLLVSFFVFGVDVSVDTPPAKPAVNIVKATVIDGAKVKAEADKQKKIALDKQRKEKNRLDQLKKNRLAEEKKLADLKKQRLQEQKKVAQANAEQAAKKARLKKEAVLAKKEAALAEKKALAKKQAAVKKKKAEAEKRKKIAADKKRKDLLAKEKAKKDKAARDKVARAKALKEQQLREQAIRARAMQQQMLAEEQELQAQAAVASYSDLIRQKVERNWRQPPGDIAGLACHVRVRLIPGGEVVDAQVIQSSGNTFFDHSVELATRKASPLPLPSDPNMFKYFRTLEFNFRPGG